MATYTHYEIANSPSTHWIDVIGAPCLQRVGHHLHQ